MTEKSLRESCQHCVLDVEVPTDIEGRGSYNQSCRRLRVQLALPNPLEIPLGPAARLVRFPQHPFF